MPRKEPHTKKDFVFGQKSKNRKSKTNPASMQKKRLTLAFKNIGNRKQNRGAIPASLY